VNLRLADQLASCWAAFAATGDPNNKTIPHWPAYRPPERATLVFDRETTVVNDPRGALRTFWEKEPPRAG
jgi:para-nitrobenzyl esterase